ncbi:PQQ-like beta-propeller repeat protein [Actibacterium lipolyticum]|uniref:Outer membrane protein assembly factor BamB n=1 Tax=Actibacterium lipolyticum TaxID=1524263 RepID=A0A238JW83_9RHOB|nr:PQQ-like beta-propeller repeat protein [Actibacterium lipolyticum]SMX34457.1 Outer membrane protein assembly factor BamB precursor [Actibacterium lipolyticum]
MKLSQGIGILTLVSALGACGERELILDGERFGVRDALLAEGAEGAEAVSANVVRPISLPAQQSQTDWLQTRGNAAHRVVHPALGTSLTSTWSVNIGAGDSRKHKITAEPVIAGGRVFTLDSQSRVMAHSTSGAVLWSADLTPATERAEDASGGGLAFGDGRLFVTTGFGALVALDPATGQELWEQKTEAAVSGAPSYRDGLVYVVSRDNRAWAITADDGRVQWQLPGTPSESGMVGGAAPAVTDRLAVFPFGSSEMVATLRKSGVRVWASSISGQRRGRVYTTISDITGDPVVDGNVIYVGNQSGRTVAISASSGERLWTANDGAYSPVFPAGDSVFLVSDQAELVRLDAATGERVWAVELPYFVKEKTKRRKSIYAHYGPVLAGGRLVVASDDGLVRFFSPESGALVGTLELPSGASAEPVVAGSTLYLVTSNGQLHAFR